MSARALAGISIAGLLVFAATIATQQPLVSSFDPARQMLSEYVHTRLGALAVAGFVAWGISLAAAAGLTIVAASRRGWMARLQAGALLAAAVGILLVACFPTDRGLAAPGVVTEATVAGQVHDAASAGATACVLLAALLGAARFPGRIRTLSLVLLSVALAASAVLLGIGDPLPGLRQRLLLAAACVWQGGWVLFLRGRPLPT